MDYPIITSFEILRQRFHKVHQDCNAEIDALELFIEDGGYDADYFSVTTQRQELEKEYLFSRKNHYHAITVFTGFIQIILNSPPNSSSSLPALHPLVKKRLYNKAELFTELMDFEGIFSKTDPQLDKHINKDFNHLKPLETVCIKNKLPITEQMVTGYHQSKQSINEYVANNMLFDELQQCSNGIKISPHFAMNNYLIEYEKAVSKPLPHDINQRNLNIKDYNDTDDDGDVDDDDDDDDDEMDADVHENRKPKRMNKYRDNITVIMQYIAAINDGMDRILLGKASYPLQLDVFFVAPNSHTELNLDSLRVNGIKSDVNSRGDAAGVSDVYQLLRIAAQDMKKEFNQRFIMLIVRGNVDDSFDDTIYIYKPSIKNSLPSVISNYVELPYLLNSKLGAIVDGLLSTDEGVLGLTHHLHAVDCNKVFLSYGYYKSRVFKHDILNRLVILFDRDNDRRHIIDENPQIDFNALYKDFRDDLFAKYGKYWFINDKALAYECYKPCFNKPSRAKYNIHIPASCTKDLNKYIDNCESFDTSRQLYYNMDYIIGMQMIDGQTVCIKWLNGRSIYLINIELHRNKNALYAVIVENDFKSKQKWKIVDYEHISEAFMTIEELVEKYQLFVMDIPKGTKTTHDFQQSKERIKVTKTLIRSTHWPSLRIVQSQQNVKRLSNHSKNIKNRKRNRNGAEEISEKRFRVLALHSLEENISKNSTLIHIVQFEFPKNQYHLEKLLPVYIPECKKYVVISFKETANKGRTEASGVCLDLIDMKNKANLINIIPSNSWLNIVNSNMSINNLKISPNKNRKSTKKGSGSRLTNGNGYNSKQNQCMTSNNNNMPCGIQTLPQSMPHQPQYSYPNVVNTKQQMQPPLQFQTPSLYNVQPMQIVPPLVLQSPMVLQTPIVYICHSNMQSVLQNLQIQATQQQVYFQNILQQNRNFNVNTVNTVPNTGTRLSLMTHYELQNYSMSQNPP